MGGGAGRFAKAAMSGVDIGVAVVVKPPSFSSWLPSCPNCGVDEGVAAVEDGENDAFCSSALWGGNGGWTGASDVTEAGALGGIGPLG